MGWGELVLFTTASGSKQGSKNIDHHQREGEREKKKKKRSKRESKCKKMREKKTYPGKAQGIHIVPL